MKLIIQIPCYNEETSLPVTLKQLPRQVEGFTQVQWLIIDDGSTDHTVEVARQHGVDYVVRFDQNRGLARAFTAGLEACVRQGADVIVNTDADNQYSAADIPKLVEPILAQQAEIVIGARPIGQTRHFSSVKKLLQKIGSWVVRQASRTDIADAPSGFRAISRNAAMQLNVFDEYTYTLETIIQAGQKNIATMSVPIGTNKDLRPSRLIGSVRSYLIRSILTISRMFVVYRPLRFFATLAAIPFTVAVLLGLRWLVLFPFDPSRTRAPSLILAAICTIIGALFVVVGLIGDLLAVNRKLLEDVQLRLRRFELERSRDSDKSK